jgi:peptidoglycan/LPS O-acetylase OafA/YrhL
VRVRAGLFLAAALLLDGPAALAQTAGKPDVTGHLPSGTWLLVVVAIVLAGYISYRLGHKPSGSETRRREGPISRALNDDRPPRERQ